MKKIENSPQQWVTVPLSPNVSRVETPQGSWVVKISRNARREMAVFDLFHAYGILCFEIESLGGNWLLYEDLRLPTLGTYLHQRKGILDAPLFFQLGCIGVQSELVGMKDRNLRNILINAHGPKLYLIDYNAAFKTDLFNRLFRPYKYYRYVARRLLFDVLHEVSAPNLECIGTWVSHFRQGMLHEQERINRLTPTYHLPYSQFTWPEKLCLKTRVTTPNKLLALFERGYASALEREKNKTS